MTFCGICRYSKVITYKFNPIVRALYTKRFIKTNTKMTSNWQEEKNKYLGMPINEKRRHYKNKSFTEVKGIPSWKEYFMKEAPNKYENAKVTNEININGHLNSDLCEKVSLWQGDITTLEVDAIVNAANTSLLGGGGVDGAIHRAASGLLLMECKTLNGCATGEAKITGGYQLPARYVIHTPGPRGEHPQELTNCYANCLKLVLDNNLRTVAFPCISTGIYGYPIDSATHVALKTVRATLEQHIDKLDRVVFVLFMDKDVDVYKNLMQIYFPVQ